MTKGVYKYSIPINDEVTLKVPGGSRAQALSVVRELDINQRPTLSHFLLYLMVDTNLPIGDYTIYVAGTGHSLDERDIGNFIGTIPYPEVALVFHVFEKETSTP